eukprot:360817-Chlamydomonas_euryale.AAC.5
MSCVLKQLHSCPVSGGKKIRHGKPAEMPRHRKPAETPRKAGCCCTLPEGTAIDVAHALKYTTYCLSHELFE